MENVRACRAGTSIVPNRSEEVVDEEDLERFENEAELKIYREYRDVLPMFRYVIETERSRCAQGQGLQLIDEVKRAGRPFAWTYARQR